MYYHEICGILAYHDYKTKGMILKAMCFELCPLLKHLELVLFWSPLVWYELQTYFLSLYKKINA
jgi:hypothetical protein